VKQQLKQITIATATAALLATSPMSTRAEDSSHEEHHSAGAASDSSDTAKPGSTPKSDAAPRPMMGDSKMMGGMMGPDHMPKMMKMMQEMHGKMMGGGMQAQPKGDTGPSSQAFNGIMMKMHQAMTINYLGNADVDFVKAMIPHHQGAIDMAKTVLAFGKDSDVKKIAGDVIEAQEKEIAVLNDWITKHGQ
jgi:Domain of unknown function (DUF305)